MSRTTTKIVIARSDGTIMGQYVLGLGEHIIGREIDSAIYIDDPHVSRSHARLIITEDAVEIEDLNSTSGTFLDGVTVRGRIPVEPAQKVHISDLYIDIVREGFRELVAGARLTGGRFTLVKLLGQGGMGAVWLARDEVHEQDVALKLLPAEMTNDDSGLQDLEREVAKTTNLEHANILKIEGLIRTEGEPPFILMEYVAGTEALQGTDLDQVRRQTPNRLMPWSGVRHYMLQLCDALEYAHQQKIAHRDIKPSNLLINKLAHLKLADFGIAASIAGTASTMTVSVLDAGTPSYMSPQQIEGRQPQAADDIYSLGATFYDLLTSKPPFYQGDVVHQVLNMEATPIEQRLKELNLQNEVPDYVSSMVMACLQKDSSLRPPTAGAVKQWIESEGKVDFVAVKQVQWASNPTVTQVGVRIAEPMDWKKKTKAKLQEVYTKASRLVSDWLPTAKRKEVLAYGIVAAVLSILIGTATWWMVKPGEINGVSAAMQAQLKEGLVAYYPFNGNAKDESGNGNDGEVEGVVIIDDKATFDGNGRIVIKESKGFEDDAHSLSLWINLKDPSKLSYNPILIAKDSPAQRQWQLAAIIDDRKIHAHVWLDKPSKVEFLSKSKYPIEDWAHVVQMWDGKKLSIYINGIFDSAVPAEGSLMSGDSPISIGRLDNYFVKGQMDNIRIYNRALSEEEVTALYDLEKPAADKAVTDKPGTLLWEFSTGGDVDYAPAIGNDGTVYFGSHDNYFYAVNGDSGKLIWKTKVDGGVISSPSIGNKGLIYCSTQRGFIYGINAKTGAIKWEYMVGGPITGSAAIDLNETIYIGSHDSVLYALDGQSGTLKWKFNTGSGIYCSPSIGKDNTVFIGSNDNYVYALNTSNGDKKWSFNAGSPISSAGAIGRNSVFYMLASGQLISLDTSTGKRNWAFQTGGRKNESVFDPSPIVGLDDTVFFGNNDTWVYAIEGKSGNKKWHYSTSSYADRTPVLGSNGILYASSGYSNTDKIEAIDINTQEKKWTFNFKGMPSSPVMSKKGIIYVGNRNGKVYAIATSSKEPAKSSWPMHGQNAQHTGRTK